jgi:hypothetical protein
MTNLSRISSCANFIFSVTPAFLYKLRDSLKFIVNEEHMTMSRQIDNKT